MNFFKILLKDNILKNKPRTVFLAFLVFFVSFFFGEVIANHIYIPISTYLIVPSGYCGFFCPYHDLSSSNLKKHYRYDFQLRDCIKHVSVKKKWQSDEVFLNIKVGNCKLNQVDKNKRLIKGILEISYAEDVHSGISAIRYINIKDMKIGWGRIELSWLTYRPDGVYIIPVKKAGKPW